MQHCRFRPSENWKKNKKKIWHVDKVIRIEVVYIDERDGS